MAAPCCCVRSKILSSSRAAGCRHDGPISRRRRLRRWLSDGRGGLWAWRRAFLRLPRLGQRGPNPRQDLLAGPGGLGSSVAHDDVDLRTDTETGRVDARFDGEARAQQQATVVMRLVVVHVDAVAVDFRAKAVSGAVDELVAESGGG